MIRGACVSTEQPADSMPPQSPLPVGGRCLHRLVEEQVERTPQATALVYGDGEQLSYRQLDQRANQLAHRLRACGIGPERLVGLYVPRGVEAVVGILGILKAGGAYVPLDPAS